MKNISNSGMRILIFIFVSLITVSSVMAGPVVKGPLSNGPLAASENDITWSGWNNYPNTNIFYRVQVLDATSMNNATVAVEIMNNYKKDVSFAIALNDNDQNAIYLPVYRLHKNKSTVLNYPNPKNVQLFPSIKSVEVE